MGTTATIGSVTLPKNAGEDSLNQIPYVPGKPLNQPIRLYAYIGEE